MMPTAERLHGVLRLADAAVLAVDAMADEMPHEEATQHRQAIRSARSEAVALADMIDTWDRLAEERRTVTRAETAAYAQAHGLTYEQAQRVRAGLTPE
jgi:uncharacterized protein YbaA (DUF1428 family)